MSKYNTNDCKSIAKKVVAGVAASSLAAVCACSDIAKEAGSLVDNADTLSAPFYEPTLRQIFNQEFADESSRPSLGRGILWGPYMERFRELNPSVTSFGQIRYGRVYTFPDISGDGKAGRIPKIEFDDSVVEEDL